MPRALRPLLAVLAAFAFALPATASAATSRYDPDAIAFGTQPSADLELTQPGTYVFDTGTGAISAPDNSVVRNGGDIGTPTVDTNIGVVEVPNPDFGPNGTEFVVRSLTLGSDSTITTVEPGDNNLIIAAYHDLDVEGTVDLNGLGAANGFGVGAGDHPIDSTCGGAGGGGSFGGHGGASGDGTPSGGTFGLSDLSEALYQGGSGGDSASGCGTSDGGAAGGGAGLVALGDLTVGGSVTVDGVPLSGLSGQGGPGGGSGGGILLMAPHVSLGGSAALSATGGPGGDGTNTGYNGGGGGGGGRISLLSDQAQSALDSVASAAGGTGGSSGGAPGLGGEAGEAGTISALPFLTVSGPTTKRAGQPASFSASQAMGAATFEWDFGDGTHGSGQTPSHIFTAAGTYNVAVTATLTDSAKTATANRSITITPALSGGGAGGGGNPQPQPQPQPPVPAPTVTQCIVPKLKGLSLSAARRKLSRAHCKLGKVKKPKLKKSAKKKPTFVVARQSPAAGKRLANGSRVNVTLAVKKPKRHKHS